MSKKVNNNSCPTLKEIVKYLDEKAKNEDKYWKLEYFNGSDYNGMDLDVLFFKGNKYMVVKLALPKFKEFFEKGERGCYDYGKDRYEKCGCGKRADSEKECECYPQRETLDEAIEDIIQSLFNGDTLWFKETKKPRLVEIFD